MRKAVITISHGEEFQEIAKLTHPLMIEYAKKINATFINLTDKGTYEYPHHLKLEVQKYFEKDEYDRILFIDTDVIVKKDSPDLFEIVPEDKLGAYEEGHAASTPENNKVKIINSYSKLYNKKMEELRLENDKVSVINWDKQYYNSGVFLVNKNTNPFLTPPGNIMRIGYFYDQNYFNLMIIKYKIPVFNIGFKFNRFRWANKEAGSDIMYKNCYFVHYAGIKNRLNFMKNNLQQMGYI